ncbi:unnamed protein product [Hymenolepis diminuta]|uniref:Nucleotid_trans domain-containing protein n=1 Tax=Hymenolepis diminuta TaxID=6216 RepID=A0A0R3SCS5_HYMDI|nr:unnamed protein product [Hymenolepis diminuta]
MTQLLYIRTPLEDHNTLRNTAEPLHPCEDQRTGNEYSIALLRFDSREHAMNFLISAGFMDVSFLPDCDVYLMPLLKALKLGNCWSTFLITELVCRENYNYLPSRNKFYGIDEVGGVPVAVDTSYVDAIRSTRRQPAGFRIHQFPDRKTFVDWFNSRNGSEFKQDFRRISGLNTYLMTFF